MRKLLFLLLLAAAPLASQQFGQVATTGAQILKINFDPRASALGYAAASVVGNASAVYTNVAGLDQIASTDVVFGYAPWFADLHLFSAAAATRIENVGVVGFQASGFSTDEEETTVEMENGTGRRYGIRHLVFGVSFARRLMDRLALGIQARYVSETYNGRSANGIAFDLGSNYDLGFNGARLALALQNFGPDFSAVSGSYVDYSDQSLQKDFNKIPLPVTFRASFSIEPFVDESYRVRLIADLVHPNDNIEHYNVGAEALLYEFLAIRAGLKLNYDDELFALGMGLNGAQFLGQNIRLDYSYEQFDILPSVHKIAIGFAIE